jgi:hypothetical protein
MAAAANRLKENGGNQHRSKAADGESGGRRIKRQHLALGNGIISVGSVSMAKRRKMRAAHNAAHRASRAAAHLPYNARMALRYARMRHRRAHGALAASRA